MPAFAPDTRSRALAATAALALQGLIAYALLTGLSVRVVTALTPDLKVFDVAPPPLPPPAPKIVPTKAKRAAGAAAPPHRRATPTPVVAPPPAIVLPPPPPLIVAAPVVALGRAPDAGATDRDGPGTGAGGEGSGRGSGSGNGGDGTGGGAMTHARQVAGEINGRRDYPRAARDAGLEGNLTTRYVIDRRGRIAACSIVQSSGYQILDAQTCRLAIARFRFEPARDADGRPVEDIIFEDHGWTMHAGPDPAD